VGEEEVGEIRLKKERAVTVERSRSTILHPRCIHAVATGYRTRLPRPLSSFETDIPDSP